MQNDPVAYEHYQNLLNIVTTDPKKRDAIMENLRLVAKENLDPYFKEMRANIAQDLKFAMKSLNQKYDIFKEGEDLKMDQSIDSMDFDSAEQLRDTVNTLNQRGVLNSGILRSIADQVSDTNSFDQKLLEQTMTLNMQNAQKTRDLGAEGAQIDMERLLAEQGRDETTDVEAQALSERSRQETRAKYDLVQDGYAEIDPTTNNFRLLQPEQKQAPTQDATVQSVRQPVSTNSTNTRTPAPPPPPPKLTAAEEMRARATARGIRRTTPS